MTQLPSLKPTEVIRKLRKAGFIFDRHAKGSHEIWYNPSSKRWTVVPILIGTDVPSASLRPYSSFYILPDVYAL